MNFFQTTKLLFQFAFRPIRGRTHRERLESFYSYQANQYDAYRERFLIGRKEMIAALPLEPGARWLDVGCGTGYLLDCAGARARQCDNIYLVDVTSSLLRVAKRRVEEGAWTNVQVLQADATQLDLDLHVDVITFSYSLTMIPDWFSALDRAYDLLKPGGSIGVADFFVTRKYTVGAVHAWQTRHFWPAWFDTDNVAPNRDHLPYLDYRFNRQRLEQTRTRVVGLPFLRPPCYWFVGKKSALATAL